MAHNIEYNANRRSHSFFSLRERAWHGLGSIVETAPTSEQAIKLANLDYEVAKRQCYIKQDDQIIEVPNTFALARTDNNIVLNKAGKTVTSVYEVIQNSEAFTFFDNVVGSKEAIFETAGVLGQGEKIFITAKLPSYIRMINSNDIVEKYLLLTAAHDGAGGIEVMLTPIRVVCNNTLNLALKTCTNKVTIRHTTNARDRLYQASKIMGLYKAYDAEFQELIQHLAKQQVSNSEFNDIIGDLVFTPPEAVLWKKAEYKAFRVPEISTRKRNQLDMLVGSIEDGVGQDTHRGSKLWILNGVSTFLNNTKQYKDNEKRFDHIMYGSGQSMLQKTLDLVLQ
jgi:phage/plasmid-like protein (TIGR03299 family)